MRIWMHACVWEWNICISYIPGTSALPDIYARLPEGTQHPRASAYISGKARGPGI